MKAIIHNPNKLVESVVARVTELSFGIYINFCDDGVYYQLAHGPGNLELYAWDKEPDDSEYTEPDKILLIAENETEKQFLGCIHFELWDRGQLWLMFVKDEVYKSSENVPGSIEYVDSLEYQNTVFNRLRSFTK